MFGQGWPVDPDGGVCVFGALDGVVLVGVVAVLLVDCVVVVAVVELGAAAAPAIPATAPPVARAPTTRPTRMIPVFFIRDLRWWVRDMPTIVRPVPKARGTDA
jgi:hypothetical protein